MDSTALQKMTQPQMLDRINAARFPSELTAPDKRLLAMVAITYGFDPLMGEITIYQGRPYVSIDGRRRKAQETGHYTGLKKRPATQEERAAWQIPDGDYFFKAEVYVKGGGFNCFEGWGRVRKAETKPGSTRQGDTTSTYKPIQFDPQGMAAKRAEAQALRAAFHIPLPSLEARGTEDDDTPPVNLETGEIIDTTLVEPDPAQAEEDIKNFFDDGTPKVTPAPVAETPPAPTQATVKPPQAEKTSQVPTTRKGLFEWAIRHGKTYSATWCINQCGFSNLQELDNTPEVIKKAYDTIREITGWTS